MIIPLVLHMLTSSLEPLEYKAKVGCHGTSNNTLTLAE